MGIRSYVNNLLVSHERVHRPKIVLSHESPNKMFLTECQTVDGLHFNVIVKKGFDPYLENVMGLQNV